MKSLFALLALALASVGCTGRTSYLVPADGDVAISPEFTAEQTEQIIAAIDEWQEASAGKLHLHVHVGGEGYATITPADLSTKHDAGATTYDHEGPGHTCIQIDAIALDRFSDRDWIRSTALHELGHAFGLAHTEEGLMRPQVSPGLTIDADALARFNENY